MKLIFCKSELKTLLKTVDPAAIYYFLRRKCSITLLGMGTLGL